MPSEAVCLVGHDEHLEVLVGLDQCIDQSKRRRHRDVFIHIAVYQEQLPLKPVCLHHVGLFIVVFVDRQPHPLRVPHRLVEPVVVIPGG